MKKSFFILNYFTRLINENNNLDIIGVAIVKLKSGSVPKKIFYKKHPKPWFVKFY